VKQETVQVPSSHLRDRFMEDGIAFLPSVLSPHDLAAVEEFFDHMLAHPTAGAYNVPYEGGGAFITDTTDLTITSSDAYKALINDTSIVELVSQFMSTPNVWFYYAQLFYKDGGNARRTPWHQDTPYIPVEGQDILRLWITLDRVDKEYSLEFVRGSHRGTLFNGSSFNPEDDTAPIYPESEMPRLPNIEADRGQWDIVSWATVPGDALAFHPSVLHGGAPTAAGSTRRSIGLIFYGEQAWYTPRPKGIVEANDGSELAVNPFEQLSAGDPFRVEHLPQVKWNA